MHFKAGSPGFTLLELIIVVAILGIVAVVAVPNFSASDSHRLGLAAREVSSALDFARSEALRTGDEYGADLKTSTQQLRLYRLDTSGSFPVAVYDVRHPVDKKLYQLQFGSGPLLDGISLQSAIFLYQGMPLALGFVGFLPTGQPKFNDMGTIRMLSSGTITLNYHSQQQQITVTPMTGRVVMP